MNPTQLHFQPLKDALDRVDVPVVPDHIAKKLNDCPPVDLLLTAIDHFYTAYTITRDAGRFSSATAEAFHDSAMEKLAIALNAIERIGRWHYDRDDAPAETTLTLDDVDGFAVPRAVRL